MPWTAWRSHFEENARRPLPEMPAPEEIDETLRPRLVASLARFQLGETGEGRIVGQMRDVDLPGIDADYRAALALFVREEGRHARVLGALVRALGGQILRATPSADLFRRVRGLIGPRFKILILLVAEVVSTVFYALVAAPLPAGRLKDALDQITGDESRHLAFHTDFFARVTTTTLGRWLLAAAIWPIGCGAAAIVLADHGATLAMLGVSRRRALRCFFGALADLAADLIRRPSRPVLAGARASV